MYRKWISEIICEYNKGHYTELELFTKFLDYMDVSKIEIFMNDLKNVSIEKFDEFIYLFNRFYPKGESLDNLVRIGGNVSGVVSKVEIEKTKQEILAIRKWLNKS